MVEGLEARQLLSGPTVNLGADFQAKYNVTLNGVNHPTYFAGDFDAVTITPAGSSTALNLPFTYCVDIPTDVALSTNYNAVVNSTNFAPPSGGYNQDPRNTGVLAINTNAIAWLVAHEGKQLNLTQQPDYVSGMALQVAIWEVEYNTPATGLGWTDTLNPAGYNYTGSSPNTTPLLTGDHFTLNTISPLSFYTTSSQKSAFQSAFTADYAADIDAVNAAYRAGSLATITPGVMFINPFSTSKNPVEQQTVISYSSPTLTTTPSPSSTTVGTTLTDTADLEHGLGGAETGTITFTLIAPDGSTVYTDVVNVSGDGKYSTDNKGTGSALASMTGTYQWNATYSGDTYDATVTDNYNSNEQVAVTASNVIIGNYVWNDLNDDGIQEAGEPGISGVTLTLTGTTSGGVAVNQTTTTDANGLYSFTEAPGTYTVAVSTPAGYVPTVTGRGTTATDSNTSPSGTTPVTLPSGGSDLTIDFGFYQPVTIGNFVWNDLNGDGIQEAGEPGISGVTLTITGTTGAGVAVSQTTTTDANGLYQFTEAPGTYSVAVTTPTGYTPTATGQGTIATDSNATPSATTPATLPGGSSDQSIDFGFYQPVTIGNYVWNDANDNGIQDAGESGISGVTLTITGTDGAGNSVTGTTTTDATGMYSFTEAPGTYTVSVTTPSGYAPTTTGQGTTATDSNPSPSGTTPGTLPSGGSDQTIDFGFYQPVTIGNYVWLDANGNGVQDSGESGISGVTLTITGTTGAGVAVSQTTTTDANGLYQFTEAPGTYSVAVTTPTGYTPTATGQGTTATDSNATPSATTPATLPGGSSDQSIDFGFYQPVSIGNYVWNDANDNGIQDVGESGISGVTVTITGTTGAGVAVSQTTTTDANGLYNFTEAPGTYTVSVTTPAGYTPTVTGQGTTATDSNPSPSGTTPGTLPSGGSDQTIDFGFYQPVTIGNYVWLDANGNGVQDTGESGISGVTLTITGTTGAGVAVSQTTTTDANGLYQFTEAPGTYSVAVTTPTGYTPTATGKGTTATDSNATPSATTPATLPGGSSDQSIDFGFYQPVTIGNYVWNDANGNGVQDAGESGISGVTLTITGTTGAGVAVSQTTTTDANGLYQFAEAPGTYSVSVTTPSGYTPTVTGKGTTATDSNATPSSTTPATLPSGGSDQSIDFGFYQPVTIGNFVWNDSNANGIQKSGEPGINGVTLTLTGTNGAGVSVTDHATTSGNGAYLFTEAPGTYTVTVDSTNFSSGGALAGYTASATSQGGNTALDSNPNPSATTPGTLAGGNSDLTIDFGYYTQPASLSGCVYVDTNVYGGSTNGVEDTQGFDGTIGGVNLGAAENYGLLGINGGDVSINGGGAQVVGNVGLGPNETGSSLQKTTLYGSVIVDTNAGAYQTGQMGSGGNFVFVGGALVTNQNVAQAQSDANAASIAYAALTTDTGLSLGAVTTNTTIAATAASRADGVTVASMSSLNYNADVLTISGNSTDLFVINITGASGALQFSQSQIVLTGGVTANHVIFNLPNDNGAVQDVINKSASVFNGTILAPHADVRYHNPAVFNGEIIAKSLTVDSAAIFNGNEPCIPGVTVSLYNSAGTLVATQVTTTTGYDFTNLVPGTYKVVEGTPPSGLNKEVANVGTVNGTTVGTAVGNDVIQTITLGSGSNGVEYDFGLNSTPVPELTVTKTADAASVVAGSTAGYVITISNAGSGTATGVTLSDPLPGGVGQDINWTIDSTKGNPTSFKISGAVGSQVLTLSSSTSLAPGASLQVHITGKTTVNDAVTSSNPALNNNSLSPYTVLYTGGNASQLSISNDIITGNIGIGGKGQLAFSGPGTINGRVDFSAANNGQYHNTNSKNVGPTSVNYSVSAVTTDLSAAATLSSQLGALGGTSITFTNTSQTINESAGTLQTLNGVSYRVFTVTAYSAVNATTNTIVGDGSGNPVVFNFSSGVNLGGVVALSGTGLNSDLVMWNFKDSGGTVQLNNNGQTFQGVILLPNDKFTSDNYNLYGRVYGGGSTSNMQIVSGANVYVPLMTGTLSNTATVSATNEPSYYTYDNSASATITIQSAASDTAATSDTAAADNQLLGSLSDLRTGTIWVSVNNSSGNVTAAEQARIQDALIALNSELGPYGVHLVEAAPGQQSNSTIQINLVDSTDAGGVAEGILGEYVFGRPITIVQGWNWYTGADASGIQSGQYDFQSVVMHELGHFLGFDHSSDSASVMSEALPAGVAHRTLTAGDLALISHEAGTAGTTGTAVAPIVVSPSATTNSATQPALFAFPMTQQSSLPTLASSADGKWQAKSSSVLLGASSLFTNSVGTTPLDSPLGVDETSGFRLFRMTDQGLEPIG
jgi:hypothetical protein